MSKDTQQAFPGERKVYRAGYATGEYEPVPGMFLRDYFAGRAMEALIRTLANTDQADDEMRRLGLGEGEYDKLVAKCAFDYADAMLEERMK